jgi:hypothetical protein
MVIALDDGCVVSALEQVAFETVPPVEPSRVDTVERVHSFGEVRLGRGDDQVEVIAHQAVCDAFPVAVQRALRKELEEAPSLSL